MIMTMENSGIRKRTVLVLVEKIIYKNEESNAVILSGTLDNGKVRQVTGKLAAPAVGSIVKVTGYWKRHEKYGWQFKAEDMRLMCADPFEDTREALQCKVTGVKELRVDTDFYGANGMTSDGVKVRMTGRLKNMTPGIDVYALGEWTEHEQYGKEFKVRQWEYYRQGRPGSLQKCMEMIAAIKASRTEGANVQEFSWNDVEMKDGFIIVPYPAGSETWCQLTGAKESFNMIKGYLAGRLPAVKVAFDNQGIGLIQNIYDLRDALSVMHVKHTLQYGTMETEEKNRDIIDAVSEMGPEATRIFVPRDVTGYLDFLQERQSDLFNLVPIEEYNGGSREEAFIFTIMIDEKPCLVWESTNPSRATFVFPCTDENYDEKIQILCSFIADKRGGKRKYLHSDASAVTFGYKPIILVHNTFESWTDRLLNKKERQASE